MVMTMSQWEQYIKSLAGQNLWSKAIAANTQTFAAGLLAEGLTMPEVRQIILLFVRQLVATGQRIPAGGAFGMQGMAEIDPVALQGATMPIEQVAQLEASAPLEEDSDFEERWFDL